MKGLYSFCKLPIPYFTARTGQCSAIRNNNKPNITQKDQRLKQRRYYILPTVTKMCSPNNILYTTQEHYFNQIFSAFSGIKYAIKPVPVAARSKAQVCGRSPVGIVGSNPTGGMGVCRECCVLSGRGLCDKLINRPDESYRLWCVVVCDLETS